MDVEYDGRVSSACADGCVYGECGESLPGLACGGCCRCLGACEEGYCEQLHNSDPHNTQDPDEYHDRCVDMEVLDG